MYLKSWEGWALDTWNCIASYITKYTPLARLATAALGNHQETSPQLVHFQALVYVSNEGERGEEGDSP